MFGLITLTVFSPVFLSLNSQGFLDSFLKEVGTVAEKAIGTVESPQTESFGIYSDDNYQTKTNNFAPNQKVFIIVKTSVDGITKKSIDLLDQNKNKINSFEMNKTDTAPFMYTKSFNAPQNDGFYYVDIEVRNGENSVYKAQQNINVGNSGNTGSNNAVVNVETKAEANTGGKIETKLNPTTPILNSTTPIATPQMTQNIAGDSGKNTGSVVDRMNEIFSTINSIILNIKKLLKMI